MTEEGSETEKLQSLGGRIEEIQKTLNDGRGYAHLRYVIDDLMLEI